MEASSANLSTCGNLYFSTTLHSDKAFLLAGASRLVNQLPEVSIERSMK